MANKQTDETLVSSIQQGDIQAERIIFRRYVRYIRNQTRHYYIAGGDRDDIIQEGLIALFNAVNSYDPAKAVSFKAYAHMCIRRSIYNAIKASVTRKHQALNESWKISASDNPNELTIEDIPSDYYGPEQLLLRREFRNGIDRSLTDKLSELERKILYMYLDRTSYQDIAECLAIDVKSVDNALRRVKVKLSKVVLEENKEDIALLQNYFEGSGTIH